MQNKAKINNDFMINPEVWSETTNEQSQFEGIEFYNK